MKVTTKKAWEHCSIEPYRTIAYNVFKDGINMLSSGINHAKGNDVYVAYFGNNMKSLRTFEEAKQYLTELFKTI